MALTEIPSELSSTPSIVDNGNATAITIGSDESVALGGTLSLPNANATNEISFTGTEFTNVLSATTSGFQLGTTGAGYLAFLTNNAEAFRLTAARDMYFGQTTGSAASVGHIMQANGALFNTRDGGTVQYLRRLNSDGAIVEFNKDGAVVGSIGNNVNNLTINGLNAVELKQGGTTRAYVYSSGFHPWNDATYSLGLSNSRWSDLYLSSGAYLGGTAAANKLDDYERGTFTPTVTTSSGSISYGAQQGGYVKVGDTVHYWIRLVATCTATATLYNLSLPFSTSGYYQFYAGPTVGNAYNVTLGSGGTVLGGYYIHANNAIRFHSYGSNTGQLAPSCSANQGFEIRMEGSYRLTA